MKNPFLNKDFPFHEQALIERRKQLIQSYFNLSIAEYQHQLRTVSEDKWLRLGQQKALNLFHLASLHVPAYKLFLRQHKIKPYQIKTFDDLQSVPTTNKPNYFAKYSLKELSWGGTLDHANTISFSSGSTGTPFFWPRGTYQDIEGAFAFEHLLTSLFDIGNKSTLLVNCFSMGNYVAGVYVYTSAHLVAQKGYPLTIVSPGVNYQDTFNILTKTIDQYDQVVLCGYPPFLRDIIELGSKHHIAWKKHHVKFFFASEFFSESWRDNTLLLAGNTSPLIDSTNIYGTADSAIFTFETPTSILVRKLAVNKPGVQNDLFESNLTPTFVQYQPLLTYFEQTNNELAITSNSGLPLIRYNLKDQGKIITHKKLTNVLESHNINLSDEQEKTQIKQTFENLPFLAVTNRTDGAVSFYAITIFPEYIRSGLEVNALRKKVSGKFSLISQTNTAHEPTLIVHVELKQHVRINNALQQEVAQSIIQYLRTRCAEYSFLEKAIKERAIPQIILHHKGQSRFFKIGTKQKWIAS